jgi:hypothetical protein
MEMLTLSIDRLNRDSRSFIGLEEQARKTTRQEASADLQFSNPSEP